MSDEGSICEKWAGLGRLKIGGEGATSLMKCCHDIILSVFGFLVTAKRVICC